MWEGISGVFVTPLVSRTSCALGFLGIPLENEVQNDEHIASRILDSS